MDDVTKLSMDAYEAARQAKANLDAVPIQQKAQRRFLFQYRIKDTPFHGEITAWDDEHAQTLLAENCHVLGELMEIDLDKK